MSDPLTVVVLFGGNSPEHVISRASAAFITDTLRACDEFEVVTVGITREGGWFLYEGETDGMRNGCWERDSTLVPVCLTPDSTRRVLHVMGRDAIEPDCIFPVLHGQNGEDGRLQGMLEMAGIPFVGCGMLASALAMDKGMANHLFDAYGIPQTKWLCLTRAEYDRDPQGAVHWIERDLSYPVFVKPANAGSSIGISSASSRDELEAALVQAFRYDRRLVLEEAVVGRELEIAALGNYEEVMLSCAGEIVPDRAFYDFDAKYCDSDSKLIIPAELTDRQRSELRELARRVYFALDLYGLSRIDFFLARDGHFLINEVNTIPGFVEISMYPKLFAAVGIPAETLVRRLIDYAMSRPRLTA